MIIIGKVTLEDISKALNISKNTVSKALRGADGVSDELRQKIYTKAIELGYKKIFVPLKKITNVTLIMRQSLLGDVTFWPKVLSGIEQAARDKHLKLSFVSIDSSIENDPFQLPSHITDDTEGLIIVGTFNDSFIKKVKVSNIPFVVIDHYSQDVECDYINSCNASGIYKLIKYLHENGHKKIGFISSSLDGFSFEERYEAYVKYCKKLDIVTDKKYEWLDAVYSDIDFFKRKIKSIQKNDDVPTAWLCINDSLAITLSRAFIELGYNIPDDFSIVGFDNISELFYPGLTTIDVPKEYRGYKAVELLLSRSEKPEKPYENILLDNKLIIRDSVKKLS